MHDHETSRRTSSQPSSPSRRAVLAGAAATSALAASATGPGTASAAPAAVAPGDAPAPTAPSADAPPQTIPALRDWSPADGTFRWRQHLDVPAGDEELAAIAETFADDLEALTGTRPDIGRADTGREGGILLRRGKGKGRSGRKKKGKKGDGSRPQDRAGENGIEAYTLEIGDTATITAAHPHGVFDATRTVLQLLAADRTHRTIRRGTAEDWPDKEVRGALVDNTPRHFSMEWWGSLFRQMSYLKLTQTNLYIDGIGLDEKEMAAIDERAATYFIELVPQLNMPGHMAQILPAHPEFHLVNTDGTKNPLALDLTNPKAVDWALDRMEEQLDAFRSPEWHLGSDEFPGWPGTGEDHPQLDEHAKELFGDDATFADLFADFQNRANARVKKHGKTMLVWNDMIRSSKVVTLDADVTVEYWIQHPDLPGLLSGPQIADRGNTLINSHVDFMYYDQSKRNLDPREIYEDFDPHRIAQDDPVPATSVRGARIAVWLAWINTPMESDLEVLSNILPPMQALSQVLWGSPKLAETWDDFAQVRRTVGEAPGLPRLTENEIGTDPAIARDAEGRVIAAANDETGSLLLARQSAPGLTRFDVHALADRCQGIPALAETTDGALVLACRTGNGRLLLARETAPAEGRFEPEVLDVPCSVTRIGLTGQVAATRSGKDLWVVDVAGGAPTRLEENASGAPSAAFDGERSVVAAPLSNGSEGGMVLARGAGDAWETIRETSRSLFTGPEVLAHEGEVRLLASEKDGTVLVGSPDGDSVTWQELAKDARLGPVGATGPDGEMHAAWSDTGGTLHHAVVTSGSGTPQKVTEDVLSGISIGFDEDGAVQLLARTGRGTLRAAALEGTTWRTAELAESTAGTAALTWDSSGRPTYVTATDYGDLQTGTRWGDITQWGRDFVIGTISTPTDDLLPSALGTTELEDSFEKDSSARYDVLEPSGKEAAPAPTIGDGRLEVTGDSAYFTLLASDVPLAAGDMSIVVELDQLLEEASSQNTIMVGAIKDEKDYAVLWYSDVEHRIGFDTVAGGTLMPSGGGGTVPAVLGAGDRLGVTVSGPWMSGFVEHQGIWSRVHTSVINGPADMTDPDVRGSYRAGAGLRGDKGTLAIGEILASVR